MPHPLDPDTPLLLPLLLLALLPLQGDIEKVAAQTSEGLMQLLEQISGSDVLRQPYEDKEKEKDAADKALAVLHNRKKAITAERKTKKEQKEEAERFLGKQQELVGGGCAGFVVRVVWWVRCACGVVRVVHVFAPVLNCAAAPANTAPGSRPAGITHTH
jgi:hypothetical protein